MRQKKETESCSRVVQRYKLYVCVCVCVCWWVYVGVHCVGVKWLKGIFFPLRSVLLLVFHFLCGSSFPVQGMPVSLCVHILSGAHTALVWNARLITADGGYEILLHSSFVLVCPILLLRSLPGFSRLSLWALCLSASRCCALMYSSIRDNVCCCRDGQKVSRVSHLAVQ